ncbi:helix-turn-helix domain-containing protein [Aliarcobacter lanthieri]|uniref:helix-turn-helix domain-containing protein n=1 Tax=Aliarcobacter lanthieri TaxID=1355374 RepID=UPI003AADCA39
MEVYERLNQILKNEKLTKREFANRLRSLEPKLRTTGEIPSENTIYSYLSGRITIPIEIIPYIAEVLNIVEQELFDISINYKKYAKFLINNINKRDFIYIQNLINSHENDKTISFYNELEQINEFIQYAPNSFIKKVIKRLQDYKKLDTLDI